MAKKAKEEEMARLEAVRQEAARAEYGCRQLELKDDDPELYQGLKEAMLSSSTR